MTWEEIPPPKKRQLISAANITNYNEMMAYFNNMTDEQAREHLQKVLDSMTFEEQSEFLRELGGEQ